MKKLLNLLLLLLPLALFSQQQGAALPSWIRNPPSSPDYFYAVGFGSSGSEEVAERKARLDASVNIAQQVEPAVVTTTSGIQTHVKKNKQLAERVTVVRKRVVANLHNTEVVKKHKFNDNGTSKVYILMQMPRKEVARSVLAEIKADKELHHALAKSKALKTLTKDSLK